MLRRWSIGLIVAALAALAMAPAALAGPKGTDRPFKATMSGYAHWEWPGAHPSGCLEVTTVTESPGNATQLGKIMSYWSHCPAEADNDADGFIRLVAANGDELRGTYDYGPEVENPDGSFTMLIPVTWTGGTGRFAAATGTATITYGVVPRFCEPGPGNPLCMEVGGGVGLDLGVPWPWWGTLEGRINM